MRQSSILTAGFALFLLTALLALTGASHDLDQTLFLGFARAARTSDVAMAFFRTMSGIAEPQYRIAGAVLLSLAMLALRRYRLALFVVVATATGAALCSTIKAITMRVRPDLLPRYDKVDSQSFPSGHAWNGTIFYGEIALIAALFVPARWRAPVIGAGLAMALLTGLSRIALGVHWPTDVLAGWLGGGTWLLFCYTALAKPGVSPSGATPPRS